MENDVKNPTARIALSKNVLKVYDVDNVETVFLKDGSEFEIELFNPTKNPVLCTIGTNGSNPGEKGLVLNPGQRYFLDRYLTDNKKFKFSTYEVSRNSEEVDKAIEDNGVVTVNFYREVGSNTWEWMWSPEITYVYNYSYRTTTGNPIVSYETTTNDSNTTTPATSGTYTIADGSTSAYTVNSLGLTGSTGPSGTCGTTVPSKLKETGRIEKGSKSKQNFTYVNKNFESLPFFTQKIKILPQSEKALSTDDFKYRRYCSSCGNKVKQEDKYCSSCGNKLT